MGREELTFRLNDEEYKNWLKAGRCLLILKDGLLPFTDQQLRAFHGDLLNQYPPLRRPCETSSCKPRGNTVGFDPLFPVCAEWQRVILKHHRQPDGTIHWTNCFPSYWRTDHWELAKAYMPRGQTKVSRADEFDASALLNLINYCDCFSSVDPKLVRQVIQCRNELMHSCEFRVKDDWMRRYRTALRHFVQQLSFVPHMLTVGRQIEDVSLFGEQRQLHVRALYGCASIANQLKRLRGFLQANKDLGEQFSSELQAIDSLEAKGGEES
uniref:Uncharacterized protein n=1 Tax=Xiphophorus couchianus TaxID=32473 RepID=A0A3B5LHY9_9TELE